MAYTGTNKKTAPGNPNAVFLEKVT